MTQPEALRLADLLEMGSIWQDQERAAAELRRLHELAMDQQGKIYALEMARSMQQKTAEALKADAERYRYLRNRNPADVLDKTGLEAGVWIDCEDINGTLVLLTGEHADETIDAERRKK